MSTWQVDRRLEIELPEVREVRVRIVSGEVAITSAPGVGRLEVQREAGPELEVSFVDGVLEIRHLQADASGVWRFIEGVIGQSPAASVVVSVPSSTVVDVGTVSAPVVVSGMERRTAVKTVSGEVTLSALRDEVDVKTVSGEIEARGIAADLRLKSVSGAVSVVNGACRWVEAKSVSGDVILDLDLDPAGVYSLTTVSGLVALRTPDEPDVLVEATTLSGRVISDFDLDWDEAAPGRKRLRRRLGEGRARLQVKTVSGDLRLLRRTLAA